MFILVYQFSWLNLVRKYCVLSALLPGVAIYIWVSLFHSVTIILNTLHCYSERWISGRLLTWEDAYYDNHELYDPPENMCFTGMGDNLIDWHSCDPLGLEVAKMSCHVYSLGEGYEIKQLMDVIFYIFIIGPQPQPMLSALCTAFWRSFP